MRGAAHVDALTAVFGAGANLVTASAVTAAKIALTPNIMAEYHNQLGSNHGFMAWFSAAQSENRLVVTAVQNAPRAVANFGAMEQEYLAAAYFSAGNIFVSQASTARLNVPQLCAAGVATFDVAARLSGHHGGDNPALTINLANNGTLDFDVLGRYFKIEDRVVIYDKYIDEAGMQLVEYIAQQLPAGADLRVFTTNLGAKCLRPAEVSLRLAQLNLPINFLCEEVSDNFRKLAHDRYVFCGSRMQIVFTAGLGCFGLPQTSGKRKNKQSKISIYALDGGDRLEIESKVGGICTVNVLPPDLY